VKRSKKGFGWRLHRSLPLWLGVIVLCALYMLGHREFYEWVNDPAPQIAFEDELVEISVADGKDVLLAGVSARDERDGDVTASIVIESMSPMMDEDTRVVTYAAFDGDNQVGKGQRKIRYTDYTPTRFRLTEPLKGSYASWEIEELLMPLCAEDCLDGDITSQIVVTDWNWELPSEQYRVLLVDTQVTNSAGIVTEMTIPVPLTMDDSWHRNYNANIELSSYLVYHPAGEKFDADSYIKSATIREDEAFTGKVKTESNLDVNTPGVYTVTYSFDYTEEARNIHYYAFCDLIVVVE